MGTINAMLEPKKVDLVGVGLNAIDTLIPLTHFPVRGSKTEYSQASILPGGQTATATIACQTWGLSTRYIGKVGNDSGAELHWREFERTGVDARLITVPDALSPQSLIIVDDGGERTVLCRRDERLLLQPTDLEQDWIRNARVLLVDGFETAAATQAAQWARDAGIPVVADLDETYSGVEDLIACVDHLIVSRDFPTRLTGERNLERALRLIKRQFGCAITAATLGADGVIAWDGHDFHTRPAYRVSVTDTTGAGDIFHAGFIYGLVQDWPLQRRLDFACAAAALNCTCSGARGGIKNVEAVEELMANTPHYDIANAAD